jgi:hypothetical protein
MCSSWCTPQGISLGADGELAGELTHTLRLGLAPAGPPQNDGQAG